MKTIIATLAATAIIGFAAHAPAQAGMASIKAATPAATAAQSGIVHQVRGRRGRFGAGLIIGLGVASALAASSAYAHDRYYSARYERERRCRRWFRQCNHGSDRACWKFESRC